MTPTYPSHRAETSPVPTIETLANAAEATIAAKPRLRSSLLRALTARGSTR